MLTHRGFSAWIVVDGEPLPEYLVSVDEARHEVSCWIPGEPGKPFGVHWQDHDGKVDTCGYITLDGHTVPGRFLFGTGNTYRAGVRSSQNTEKPFEFRIGAAGAGKRSPDIGNVGLKIKRIKRVAARPANTIERTPQPAPATQGGDIRVGYGKDIQAFEQYAQTWSIRPFDEEDGPKPKTYVSFIFRYRTQDFLFNQGLILKVKPTVKHEKPDYALWDLDGRRVSGPHIRPSPAPATSPTLVNSSPPDHRPASPERDPESRPTRRLSSLIPKAHLQTRRKPTQDVCLPVCI
ncbi:hypothetical protein CYLTODRAFT_450215 [Cylindrobasidium torrendii FP15055 ss-10]|uniref:Uncharacterized protein n=1 Tax=Cylindrobasidium torrendii FP15055 ss-10 TaxID=1314674 RepID=A0A0D7BR43_9AGAR|nr:hypothetical protein CYLTODRAFT_450215 [Cylindrobasidium torrendii FP15055 ss-10]